MGPYRSIRHHLTLLFVHIVCFVQFFTYVYSMRLNEYVKHELNNIADSTYRFVAEITACLCSSHSPFHMFHMRCMNYSKFCRKTQIISDGMN